MVKDGDQSAEEAAKGYSVQKHVFSEAIQHPSTLLPAAAALLGSGYLALISFDPLPFKIALAGAFAAAGSWVYHYFIRGEKVAEAYAQKLKEQHVRKKEAALEGLIAECKRIRFSEGIEAGEELLEAHRKLAGLLATRMKKKQSASAARFNIMAADCYEEGVRLLGQALESHRVLKTINRGKLNSELVEWRRQHDDLENRNGDHYTARRDALAIRIRSNQRRLDLFQRRHSLLEQLLAQCEVLEAALESAYLEVVDLMDGASVNAKHDPAQKLADAVNAARRVEERLRGVEAGMAHDEDELYRQAGSSTS